LLWFDISFSVVDNPSLEFYLNYPRKISEDGVNKIIESRSSFEDVWGKITQSSYILSKAQKVTFKKHWDSRRKAEYAAAHNNLGIALVAEGKNEEAISHYKMAIKLNPNYTNAHYNLGIVLVQKGEMKEAVHHFRETLKLKPDFVAARNHLELALLRLQELE